MSINEHWEKIKHFSESEKGRAGYMIALILLASASSFGLGRLSKTGGGEAVQIDYQAQSLVANTASAVSTPKVTSPSSKAFVASRKGKKYYPAGCAGAASLKEDNKVFFSTEAEVEAAGYSKSSGC